MTDYLKIPWEAGDYPAGVDWAAEIRLNPTGIKPFIRVSTHNVPGLDAYELVKHVVALHNAALEKRPRTGRPHGICIHGTPLSERCQACKEQLERKLAQPDAEHYHE